MGIWSGVGCKDDVLYQLLQEVCRSTMKSSCEGCWTMERGEGGPIGTG